MKKKQFAEHVGVSPAAVTAAIKTGRLRVDESGEIDPDDNLSLKFVVARKAHLHKTGRRPSVAKAPEARTESVPNTLEETDLEKLPEKLREIRNMSLLEAVGRYGSDVEMKTFAEALKKLVDTHTAMLKNAETEGQLVSRDLVVRYVLVPVRAGCEKMLQDAPRQIVKNVQSVLETGAEVVEAEHETRKILGKILEPLVHGMLNGARDVVGVSVDV